MSAHDFERLGILAVKAGVTRQQLLKQALEEFLAARAAQYGCACLGACNSNCGTPARSAHSPNALSGRSMRIWVLCRRLLLLASFGGAWRKEPETMAVPDNYRQWVFLTSSLDLNYNTAARPSHHMLDNVFVDPKAYAAFQKTGTWPDRRHPDQGKPHGGISRHAQQGGPVSGRGDESGNPHQGRQAVSRQMVVLCFAGRQGAGRVKAAQRQLLFLSPGSRRGGYDLCAVLSDPDAGREREGHAQPSYLKEVN